MVYGDEAAPTSRLVADMTLEEFRQLAPINATSAAAAPGSLAPQLGAPCIDGDDLCMAGMGGVGAASVGQQSGMDTPLLGSSPTAASTASFASLASSLDSLATASTASSSASSRRLLRKHKNGTPAVPHEPTLRAWACEEEDHFPTLLEVGLGRVGWGGWLRVRVARAAGRVPGWLWQGCSALVVEGGRST